MTAYHEPRQYRPRCRTCGAQFTPIRADHMHCLRCWREHRAMSHLAAWAALYSTREPQP